VSSRNPLLRLQDIIDAIEKIRAYTAGMTYEQFTLNELVVDAVLMNFTVVGEAAGNVPAELQTKYPDVPWRQMREMRNVLVHVYFHVSRRIVWSTLTTDLEPLLPRLRAIIDAENATRNV
jgi:uncharacterized protein with HEPN domain